MTSTSSDDQSHSTDTSSSPEPSKRKGGLSALAFLGPGILVAATGVGAGDLATATFTGTELGTAILWAVVVGAALKYLLNEGLTRWQLATGTTILEGTISHLGTFARWFFFCYLVIWSYLVAMALMSACGVAAFAILPWFEDPSNGKIVFGVIQSIIAYVLVLIGGYQLFETIMRICIGVMFLVVCVTAVALSPNWLDILSGLTVPRIPNFSQGGLDWTVALLGGVGGTVTVLCYGYWIREEGRNSVEDLRTCRLDLAVGYTTTAFFGLAMVVIGSQLGKLDGSGATLVIEVGRTLEEKLGSLGLVAKWSFLFGAWGAVFSSLLGVWQSVPYIFADFWRLMGVSVSAHDDAETPEEASKSCDTVTTSSRIYRLHLAGIAVIPISGIFLFNFNTAMKINGMVGALFIPMLASVLLVLNGSERYVGSKNRNRLITTILLLITLAVFIVAALFKLRKTFA